MVPFLLLYYFNLVHKLHIAPTGWPAAHVTPALRSASNSIIWDGMIILALRRKWHAGMARGIHLIYFITVMKMLAFAYCRLPATSTPPHITVSHFKHFSPFWSDLVLPVGWLAGGSDSVNALMFGCVPCLSLSLSLSFSLQSSYYCFGIDTRSSFHSTCHRPISERSFKYKTFPCVFFYNLPSGSRSESPPHSFLPFGSIQVALIS